MKAEIRTAAGTARTPSDFTTVDRLVVIGANATTATVSIPIRGDTTVEPNEQFTVNLSNAIVLRIIDSQAIVTITNDD